MLKRAPGGPAGRRDGWGRVGTGGGCGEVPSPALGVEREDGGDGACGGLLSLRKVSPALRVPGQGPPWEPGCESLGVFLEELTTLKAADRLGGSNRSGGMSWAHPEVLGSPSAWLPEALVPWWLRRSLKKPHCWALHSLCWFIWDLPPLYHPGH